MGLSGGVDSSVVAALLHKAIGDQLICMFIDHGLLRKGEAESVMETFGREMNINLVKIDAKERFLSKLAGVSDPEKKRKIIGNEFVYTFDEEVIVLNTESFSTNDFSEVIRKAQSCFGRMRLFLGQRYAVYGTKSMLNWSQTKIDDN